LFWNGKSFINGVLKVDRLSASCIVGFLLISCISINTGVGTFVVFLHFFTIIIINITPIINGTAVMYMLGYFEDWVNLLTFKIIVVVSVLIVLVIIRVIDKLLVIKFILICIVLICVLDNEVVKVLVTVVVGEVVVVEVVVVEVWTFILVQVVKVLNWIVVVVESAGIVVVVDELDLELIILDVVAGVIRITSFM
jgi:hypothetical protein